MERLGCHHLFSRDVIRQTQSWVRTLIETPSCHSVKNRFISEADLFLAAGFLIADWERRGSSGGGRARGQAEVTFLKPVFQMEPL